MKKSMFYGYLGLCLAMGAAACSPAAESVTTTKQTEPVNTGYYIKGDSPMGLFTVCVNDRPRNMARCGNATLVHGNQDDQPYMLTCAHLVDLSVDTSSDALDFEQPFFDLSAQAFDLSKKPFNVLLKQDAPAILGFKAEGPDDIANYNVLDESVVELLISRTWKDDGTTKTVLEPRHYEFKAVSLQGFERDQEVTLASRNHLIQKRKFHNARVLGVAQQGKAALIGYGGGNNAPPAGYSCGIFLSTPKQDAPLSSKIPVLGIYVGKSDNAEIPSIGVGYAGPITEAK